MDTIDKAADLAHDTYDMVASTTNQAVEALSERGEQLKSAEQQLMKNCRKYVRDNPMASLCITAAVSFVLGRLLSRR